MLRALPTALFLSLFFLAQVRGQDVFVPRELKAIPVTQSDKERPSEAPVPKALSVDEPAPARSAKAPVKEPAAKNQPAKAEAVKPAAVKEPTAKPSSEKVRPVKAEPAKAHASDHHSAARFAFLRGVLGRSILSAERLSTCYRHRPVETTNQASMIGPKMLPMRPVP